MDFFKPKKKKEKRKKISFVSKFIQTLLKEIMLWVFIANFNFFLLKRRFLKFWNDMNFLGQDELG